MASSASPFPIDDQTDEDFFDKLVDGEFDGSEPKQEEITRVLSNISLGDVSAGLDASQEPETTYGDELAKQVDVVKPDEPPREKLLAFDGSFPSETSDLLHVDKPCDASHGIETVKSDGSKGTSVKEVQWSAFSVDSSLGFEKAAELEPYSDFLTQDSDGFVAEPVENFSSNTGSNEQEDYQFYGSTTEQAVDQNDPQYWENLYPGWKFDASTGQWYQLDNYDTVADSPLSSSDIASTQSQNSSVSYLQQSSQSVLETIAEESTVSTSTSNWNKVSEGGIEYPPNMVFDPQYPEWYYDTNIQQWYTLESYTQGLANSSNAAQGQLSDDTNASAGLVSDLSHSLYSDGGNSEHLSAKVEGNQESVQAWDASVYGQNSLYSNISQSVHHASQSEGNQAFSQNWDASMSNYDQANSFYDNNNQPEQVNSLGWGSHEVGPNRSVSMSNLAERNSLYSNITTATHHATRSQGSQDFAQNWTASMGNYAQKQNFYSNAQQGNQVQSNQGFDVKWDASKSTHSQSSMWQPQPASSNAYNVGFGGYNSMAERQTIQGTSFQAFEPHASQSYEGTSAVTGIQGFTPKENMYSINPPKMVQTLQSHLSNSYHGDENMANYPHQSFQSPNASQYSYTPNDGRSSAGRPPHALVAFGFGGKLIVMKNANCGNPTLDFGNQGSASCAVSVLTLSDLVTDRSDGLGGTSGNGRDYFHALCQPSFPGPLVGGSAATKDVTKWIDEKIGKCESANKDFQRREYIKLLFSLLKILCQHYGKLRSPFGTDPSQEEIDGPESAVTKLFASARSNGAGLTEFGSVKYCMQNLPSEGQTRAAALHVQNLLVSGRRKEALQYAQEGQLWGPALVLAALLGEKFYVDTVKKMAQRQFVYGSPLRTLCLLIAGEPGDVFSADSTNSFHSAANELHGLTQAPGNDMLDDWEENLAIITANRTKGDDLVITFLGDLLLKKRGEIIAAHICYLVAEKNFESFSDSARLCLIGANHWKSPRTYASPEAIQRTEVYEYSKVLGNSQYVLQPFQPYKLIYAYMLAEVGKVTDSLRYCQASLKLLKSSERSPEVELWKASLTSLEERLRTHQQGGYSSNLAPAKLVGKLFTSIDRSIHRMIGAPPAPQSQMPQMDATTVVPKVASSQSTMAMSSLMPSQSVEGMSDWNSDGNWKSMHNRSISEPDFGRTPKQNSPKDAGSGDGQNKSSPAPSRFGRIGSALLQKTVGWVARSRPDRQAKLGESNKFYYDEKLKRWVEEGAEPPAEEAALPPPPTTVFQNGASDYNINNVLKNQSPANRASETNASAPVEPPSSGVPPIPPSQNQFSARGRMGVRSRYVDTFNKGGSGGSGGSLTSSFQSPSAPSVKPAVGAKFFMPMAPAPVPSSDELNIDAPQETVQEPTSGAEASTSIQKEPSFPFTSASPPTMSPFQRFPSMDNISPFQNSAASHSGNGLLSRSRAASWSGAYPEVSDLKMAGLRAGAGSPPPPFLPQNPPSTRSSSSASLHLNGGHLGDELQEVEL